MRRLLLPTAADEYAFVLPDQYRANIAKQNAAAQASSRALLPFAHHPQQPGTIACMRAACAECMLSHAADPLQAAGASQDLLHVFDWFQHQVALCCLEDTIARVELRRLLGNSR